MKIHRKLSRLPVLGIGDTKHLNDNQSHGYIIKQLRMFVNTKL